MRRKLYSCAKNLSKIRRPLDMLGVRSIQNECICNADITPNWNDICNAYMNEINKISPLTLRNFTYLVDMLFAALTQIASQLRISTVPLAEIRGSPLKRILVIGLFIVILLSSVWFVFGLPPTKATVEKFLKENSCNPSSIETDYSSEYYCAAYLRRHTTLLCGQIIKVPEFTFLFVFTPFHYFNYIDPTTSERHVYVFVVTRDNGTLVYNPVNGEYVGRFDDLLQNMGNISYN